MLAVKTLSIIRGESSLSRGSSLLGIVQILHINNANGWTCLHEAVCQGQVEFVEFILESQELHKLINMTDKSGKTALRYAVRRSLLLYSSPKRQTSPCFPTTIGKPITPKTLNWVVTSLKTQRKLEVLHWPSSNWALFRYEIFLDFTTVALSFICGKYYLIID